MAKLPSFSALCAFEAAARFASFKDAAAELHLSTSAISHQVRSLEQQLGVSLFDRTNNGVSLTKAGLAYFQEIEPALASIEKATNALTLTTASECLRVSLLSSLSTLWLIPELENFHCLHPDITLELQEDLDVIDFRNDSVDAALRYDFHLVGQWKGLVAVPLIEELVIPICSESYLKKHGPINKTENDLRHTLLVNSRHPDEWDTWFAEIDYPFDTSDFESTSVMDTSNMTLTAAANGLGIALGRTPFVNQLLNTKRVIRAHEAVQNRGMRNYLVYPENTPKLEQLSKFSAWLKTLPSMPK